MSSRSLDYFDASKIIFQVFSSPTLNKSNIPMFELLNNLSGVGGVEGAGSLGAYSSRGCASANRHSLHFLRGRDLFNHLEIDYLEVLR